MLARKSESADVPSILVGGVWIGIFGVEQCSVWVRMTIYHVAGIQIEHGEEQRILDTICSKVVDRFLCRTRSTVTEESAGDPLWLSIRHSARP